MWTSFLFFIIIFKCLHRSTNFMNWASVKHIYWKLNHVALKHFLCRLYWLSPSMRTDHSYYLSEPLNSDGPLPVICPPLIFEKIWRQGGHLSLMTLIPSYYPSFSFSGFTVSTISQQIKIWTIKKRCRTWSYLLRSRWFTRKRNGISSHNQVW